MLLYHGSNVEVRNPDFSLSKRYLDFGIGFYLTSNEEQAVQFSHKVVLRESKKRNPVGSATVTTYEFDLVWAYDNLNVLEFARASDNWFDYIISNRLGIDLSVESDIVIGPVANDDVYKVVDSFESGMLSRTAAIDALKIKELFNQYTLKTEASLKLLRFVSSRVYSEGE